MTKLTSEQRYMDQQQVLIPDFKAMVDKNVASVLYDIDGISLIATNLAAGSIGLTDWSESHGLSYHGKKDSELMYKVFKNLYTKTSAANILDYFKKIAFLQESCYEKEIIINYIDLLPYGGKFKTYFMTLMPIFHQSGDVVALQSYAVECKFLGFQEQLADLLGNPGKTYSNVETSFTQREQEIMFLLTYGVTQDQIAQILNVSRGTIGNIISKQLCVKYGISGSNTRLLMQAAIEAGIHQHMPASLIRPCVMVLNAQFEDIDLISSSNVS